MTDYAPVLVTAPTVLPVSLADVALQVKLGDSHEEDVLVDGMIRAATEYCERVTGRKLIAQVWTAYFDAFASELRLPFAPVIAAAGADPLGVHYLDTNGATQLVASSNYQTLSDERGPFIRFKSAYSFPSIATDGPAVSVTASFGFATAAALLAAKPSFKRAILLLVGHWYANRETVNVGNISTELEYTVNALLGTQRRGRFG